MARQVQKNQPSPRKLHTLLSALRIDDEEYRTVILPQYSADKSVRSSKDLHPAQLVMLVRDLEQRAISAGIWKQRDQNWQPAHGKQSLMGKIEAMLADAGRPLSYADGMAQHMFQVQSVRWCDADQLRRIIAALTYDQKRRATKQRGRVQSAEIHQPIEEGR